MRKINLNVENFSGVNVSIRNELIDDVEVLVVSKAKKLMEFDENTYAKLKKFEFENGVIEVEMLSRLLPDAPDFARGFIGIAFGINNEDSKFESFYIRPTNSVTVIDDPVRNAHGCQYFAYPSTSFQYFRDNNITRYEARVSCELNKWMKLKVILKDRNAAFYLDDKLLLTVDQLINESHRGSLGFFVDIGTEAFYRNLCVEES